MRLKDTNAVIVDAVRTPMGKAKGGQFRQVRAEALSVALVEALKLRNTNWQNSETDDLIWGCVNQTLEQGLNIGRRIVLMSGLSHTIPGQTVNRLCASSMQAVYNAVMNIRAGAGDTYIAGGVEHMGHVPMDHGVALDPASDRFYARASHQMGLTAELLARMNGISRQSQDDFALRSHRRALEAQTNNRWQLEIVPIEGLDQKGFLMMCDQDEVIRGDSTAEVLAALKPIFDPISGTVTAGSSSALSDGAAALLVMSAKKAQAAGLPIRAVIRAMSLTGCEPAVMGYGPVPATQKVLSLAGLDLEDIDLIEINEAFAAQTLAVIKALKLQDKIESCINISGGAIALGHPLGCSGARIITTLLNNLEHTNSRMGLATLCVGMGQGMAVVIERV